MLSISEDLTKEFEITSYLDYYIMYGHSALDLILWVDLEVVHIISLVQRNFQELLDQIVHIGGKQFRSLFGHSAREIKVSNQSHTTFLINECLSGSF